MVLIKLLLAIAFVACLVQRGGAQTCTTTASSTTCSIPVTLFDHAPAWMTHSRWPEQWWAVNLFYDFPLNGSSGTANGTYGWSNSDFELPLPVLQGLTCCSPAQKNAAIINGELGLVGRLCLAADGSDAGCGHLGSDLTPMYAYPGASKTGQVSSPQSFYQFFHNVEQTLPVPFNVVLKQDAVDPRVRTFVNMSFFPLDGLGWNDWQSNLDDNKNFQKHNYGFCMVMHTFFTYSGGEYFYFLGDDDVYAYINGYLIMDLGGVHTAQNASILVDNLKLTKGASYRFDFFYCERHSTSSEISFSTTISFFCPYVDWCGQCSGDGQSCCENSCDDGNLCTVDTCGITVPPPGGCVHTNVTCPPSTPCSNSFCDPSSGKCITTPVNCDDGNACTVDTCGPNGCSNLPRTDCASSNPSCNITGCNPSSGCYSSPVTCSSSNKCVTSSCVAGAGCVQTNVPCVPPTQCQTAFCSPTQGCLFSNISCDDHNLCTSDSCDPNRGCVYSPVNITATCGASDKCQLNSCDALKGCVTNYTTCAAPDACHSAICDPKAGCQSFANVSCPSNACFNGACNPTTGACVYTPASPCPSKPCFTSACNNFTGCSYTPVSCPTTQNCTSGTCSNNQCVYTNLTGTPGCGDCGFRKNCDVSDPCNPQVCVTINGVKSCVTQPVTCNDLNPCTNDTCLVVNGQAQCQNTAIVCSGGDSCHPQSCSPTTGTCVFQNVSCNDNNPCTNDACVVTGSSFTCSFVPIQCLSSDPFCHPAECRNGVCVNASLPDCSDGNSCTFDECMNGACQNPLVCPDSGTLCNPIVCLNGTCVQEPVNCTSGNLCSIDTCDPNTGNCLHVAKNCNGTTCAPSSCNSNTGLCEAPELLDCNDGNPCTLDQRVCTEDAGFACNNTDESYVCDSHSACILDFCNSTSSATTATEACYHQNVTCAAPTICQVVSGCDAKNGCFYAPKICPAPADWCQVAICDEIAGCLTVARACAPQDNYCFSGVCDSVAKKCTEQQRPDWTTITGQSGVTCFLIYSPPVAKVGISAGIIAAIVIAAVVAAALFTYAGKKGVDIFLASRAGPIGGASTNPLYEESAGTGTNPTYGRE